MSEPIQISKTALRRRMRAVSIEAERRAAASAAACALIEEQPVWQKAHSVLFYAPVPEELDIWPLVVRTLATGRTVCLPRFDPTAKRYVACQIRRLSEVLNGRFGIREPGDQCAVFLLERLDLVLVPGMAFDAQGRRLGRGKGFYDQLLTVVSGAKCGVSFDEQILPEIPVEPHDVLMDYVVTPTRWIRR
jgi:5-formyltetrahydrofolate cyclo-ligase